MLREERFWNEAKAVGTGDAYQAYLDRYPDGEYAGLAKASIRRLAAAPALPNVPGAPVAAPASAEKAPSAVATATPATPPRAATGDVAPSNAPAKLASVAAPATCAAQEASTRSYAIGGSFPIQVSEGIPCAVVEYHSGDPSRTEKVTVLNGSGMASIVAGRRLQIVGCQVCP